MPELPEVEVYKNYFNHYCLQQVIKKVEVNAPEILKNTSEQELNDKLLGETFSKSERHGKHLFVPITNETGLAIHFGMTGKLTYLDNLKDIPSSTHLLVHFKNGKYLVYTDRRKIGRISFVASLQDLIKKNKLGPDALGISWDNFKKTLEKRRTKIKASLMDQSLIAGIGNVYADEILFQSKIHPETKCIELDETELKEIFENIEDVLQTSIKHEMSLESGSADYEAGRKSLPEKFIIPKRKQGEHCPRCKSVLEMTEIGGRTTFFCPSCQKLKKVT